jgi:hypothetical protein
MTDASPLAFDTPSPTIHKVAAVHRRRWQFRLRGLILLIAITAVWVSVLRDTQIALLLLMVVGMFGVTLVVMAVAMGLGLLGFGVCSACDLLVSWLYRASHWPDD